MNLCSQSKLPFSFLSFPTKLSYFTSSGEVRSLRCRRLSPHFQPWFIWQTIAFYCKRSSRQGWRVHRHSLVACVYDESSGQQLCYLRWDNIRRSSAWQMFLSNSTFLALPLIYTKRPDINLKNTGICISFMYKYSLECSFVWELFRIGLRLFLFF